MLKSEDTKAFLKRSAVWGSVLAGILLIVLFALFQLRPMGGATVEVTIPAGTSRWELAKQLKQQKLIRSDLNFFALVVLSQRTIKAGTYTINPEDSLFKIMAQLSAGKERQIRLTIPEGWRKEQIANELTKQGLDGATFLTLAKDKEGYLFPDTYFFPITATPEQVLAAFEANFQKRTQDLGLTREQVIVASIVERESQRDDQRGVIAGIFLNRLKIGMKLDADPTVQYAKDTNLLAAGTPPTSYWGRITLADYSQVVSPYNTYLHTGLPPTPIANPGLKSLKAVQSPAKTDAIYFFHTRLGDIVTSRTLEEHGINKQKFLR